MCADERMLSLFMEYPVYRSHSAHNVTLRRTYTKLEWLFSRIFLFTLRAQRDRRSYTKLEWLFYRIFLFTLRAQRDRRSYTKLEWLFYRIFLFTLRAQRDRRSYTKLEWLFYRIFLFTLRAQRDRRSYTKLEWLFYRIFLFTLRAQRDGRSYTRLPTSVGLAQARPNKLTGRLYASQTHITCSTDTELLKTYGSYEHNNCNKLYIMDVSLNECSDFCQCCLLYSTLQ